ncbi:hypothetical protein N7456_003016 [Penicillium angulare]|uniref:Uncharacterized protein n=1 Tax=Penicillium angulare TaxID=116970 RepID=A0A9W9FTU4_9EURO|nr:hypothetical protein N7456_003016 [Penicillium angulare]
MVINTIYGYNTAGRVGPSGTSVVFPLDLDQVSTIVPTVSATRQLTLNDLGTDCPQSEDPSVIATAAPDGRCDPILAAPEPVKSWASPCNACGNFGLFDPPYAVPTVTGGLVPTSTTSTTQSEVQSTSTVITTTEDSTSSDEGTTLVPESTTSTLSDATESESYTQSSTSISSVLTATESYVSSSSNTALVSGPTPSPSWSASPSNTPIMTASATKSTGSIFLFALSLLISACLI